MGFEGGLGWVAWEGWRWFWWCWVRDGWWTDVARDLDATESEGYLANATQSWAGDVSCRVVFIPPPPPQHLVHFQC